MKSIDFLLEYYQQLDEIAMTPKRLKKMAADIGAVAGMEFEMIVPNVVDPDPDDYELEPDFDRNESVRDIDDACNFFYDGDYNSRRDIQNLREEMTSQYYEWLDEHKIERWGDEASDYVRDWLWRTYEDDWREEAEKEILDDTPEFGVNDEELRQRIEDFVNEKWEAAVEDTMANMGSDYDQAYDEWSEDFNDNADFEQEWLESAGYETMIDIRDNFDVNWPHYITPEQEGADISSVAEEFSDAVGMPVNSSERYHGGRREQGKYVVEPDGSLEPDDSNDTGLEFVSPPMSIDKMLEQLKKVQDWAKSRGCYTNQSTGLHINISVPDYDQSKLDYVKLALLMGDEYVLELFGRSGNTYAKSAMGKIRDILRSRPEAAEQVLSQMKGHMDGLATKAIHSGTTDKYTSINTKSGYIEFRSPGGDWLGSNFTKIESTLLRFTVALSAAMDPDAYREEYLKKLYKLLSPKGENDPISYFARYSAGELPKSALRSFVKQVQLQRKIKRGKAEGEKFWWKVTNPANTMFSIEVVASDEDEAIESAILPGNYPEWARVKNTLKATPIRPYQQPKGSDILSQTDAERRMDLPDQTGDANYEIIDRRTGRRVFVMIANTEYDARRKYADWLSAAGYPIETEDFGFREIGSAQQPEFVDTTTQSNRGDLTPRGPGPWEIYQLSNNQVVRPLEHTSRPAAEQEARSALGLRGWDPAEYGVRTRQQEPRPLGAGQELVGWKIVDAQGRTIHEFSGVGNVQADANNFAVNWLRRNPQHMQAGVEVVPNWRPA